jgi:hypothetical protein
MNKCPRCQATANLLRLFRRLPYICPKCGGRFVHDETRMDILNVVAALITAAAAGVLYEKVAFVGNSTFWLILCAVLVFAFSVVMLRWTCGRLSPLSDDDPHASTPVCE